MDTSLSKDGVAKIEDCENLPLQSLPDPEKERRLVRKLDRTILPWIMLLYLLSYIDRQAFYA
jgi:hypothetical protein